MDTTRKDRSLKLVFSFVALALVAGAATVLIALPGGKKATPARVADADADAEVPATQTADDEKSRWAAPENKEELRQRLTSLQYRVTQENGTERAFANEFWDNHAAGIYVDIVSGEPLFSSTDKYESGTGWPSFVRPLEPEHVVEKRDISYGMIRTEVRSQNGDSHLGHLFKDGPAPTGLRYCINSASLRFVPKEDLPKEGLGDYLKLFEGAAEQP